MAFVDADKLSYEIFSVLESKFLFGLDDPNKLFFPTSSYSSAGASPRTAAGARGRIRILSIDGGGSPSDALLAAVALARLESSLRHRSGDPSARVAYMFDVAAGSGAGGVLVAMLFTRDHDGRPLFSATDALHLLLSESRRRGRGFSSGRGLFRGMFRRPGSFFRRIFGDATLRDTVKPVLIPCYDLARGAPFLFSRADAVEADGYDFRMWEVCAATCADASTAAVDLRSVDGRTRVTAVGAGVAMANPVAAAITHVLHNKPEFPFAAGVEDLMVVSLGASAPAPAAPGAAELVRIAGEGFADMDTAFMSGNCTPKTTSSKSSVEATERVLSQRHVESLLFRGRGKISERTNDDELDRFAEELVKEEEWRKKGPIPTVVLKQVMTPRTSSATTATTVTVTTTISTSTTST
ncbi:patatin-like protein 3 isoform X2 [Musa acuminata AAA Group]|uniref:patatin-like protein 3 isoform X2 n=1 Tax=Musa acuminata AAA Group TaxID=214697 RepID=UPI0031DAD7AE